jgi:hypothetical protein
MTRGILASTLRLGRLAGAAAVRTQVAGTLGRARRARRKPAADAAPGPEGRVALRRGGRHAWFALAGTLVTLPLLADPGPARAGNGQAATPDTARETGTAAAPSCGQLASFDRHHFARPTHINNRWLPLIPGTRFTLVGQANGGGGLRPHRVVSTVTELTKVIDGVRARVVLELDIDNGQLQEAELAFHAQDDAGNVWNLGEYPEEHENGRFVGAPDTWIAGVAGAKAGVLMPARPRLGTPSYRQGFAPDIEFLDCAKTFATDRRTCVPGKCYDHVLVTDEWSPLDPAGGHQRKFYAPGVGNVRVGAVNDPEAETLVLVDVARLDPRASAEACERALRLERRAYRVSDVYRHTPPMEGCGRIHG